VFAEPVQSATHEGCWVGSFVGGSAGASVADEDDMSVTLEDEAIEVVVDPRRDPPVSRMANAAS
jgi:hypothetical protein